MYAKHFALQYHIFLILSSDLCHVGNAFSMRYRVVSIFTQSPYPWEGKHAKNEKRKGKKIKDKRKRKRKKGNNGRLTPAKKKHTKKERKKEKKRNHKAPKEKYQPATFNCLPESPK